MPLREAVPRRVRALSMQLVITISYAKRTTCYGVMAIADPGDTDLLSVAESAAIEKCHLSGTSVCTVSSVRYGLNHDIPPALS